MKVVKILYPLVLLLVGCQSTPYAVIDGGRKIASDDNNYEVRIKAIDGQLLFSDNIKKNIKPGPHLIVLETTKLHRSHKNTTQAFFPIVAEPCMLYRVTAQYKNNADENWEINLIETTKVPLCEPHNQQNNQGATPKAK